MKKRMLSLVLAVALCLTLLPVVTLAAGEATHANHCVCGATHTAVGDHTTASVPTAWTATDTLPTMSGHYYLTADVTLSTQWKIENNKDITLCLNGHTLTANNASCDNTIYVVKGTLTVTDCTGIGKITGNNISNSGSNHHALQVAADGRLNLFGGSISKINAGGGYGGGIHNKGTFNMYGGSITDNKAKGGGGVFNNGSSAIFNLYGGTISDNTTTTEYGNDVHNYNNATMNANGGTVAGKVWNEAAATIGKADGYNGTTFNGDVTNGGTISGGIFNGTVTNGYSGLEENKTHTGKISGGTYNSAVTNASNGTINDGKFTGAVTNNGTISDGTFSGPVDNEGGTINGGTFIDPNALAWLTPVLGALNTASFDDVAIGDWFYDDVQYVNAYGLMTGTSANQFSPNAPVTRGMVMTILARREGIKTDRYSPWYAAGCEWAKVNGISDGTNPEAPITREQLAAMLYRYAGLKGYDLSGAALASFGDASSVSGYATPAVQWAVGAGLLTGTQSNGMGELLPQDTATRAQLAAMLYRFFG